jgi:peptide-methionine (R)-S-oxide reductase
MEEGPANGPVSGDIRMLTRRHFTRGLGAAAATLMGAQAMARPSVKQFEIQKSEDEWRKLLTREQFYVLREHGTERAFTSPLNDEKRKGTFVCAGCDLPLFSSDAKYDSGTGWPSFWAPLDNAVGTSEDRSWFMTRTEVHCRRCGGHLGHVFPDGPKPTGQRYCMNGVAMKFVPAADQPAS